MDLYNVYKPLRNHLRPAILANSFYVIWAYANNIDHGMPFPKDVVPVGNFAKQDKIQRMRWVSPWELEILAKEIIINSDPFAFPKKTLANPAYFAGAINKLKDIRGAIGSIYINAENIPREIQRVVHEQFPWQVSNPSSGIFARYYKIYSDPTLNAIIKDAVGLSVPDIYFIGVVLWGFFHNRPAMAFPLKIEVEEITPEKLELFLKFFCRSASELKPILQSEQQMNEKYSYAFHSLKRFPLIRCPDGPKESLYCPLVSMFFQQMLGGVYYGVYDKPGFDNAFGRSFQSYVGEVLKVAHTSKNIRIYPEEQYGKFKYKKDTVDWVVEDSGALLFVECKTKRLTYAAKTELLSDEGMDKEIDKMAGFIVQVYKTISDYQKGLYPSLKLNPAKQIIPMVVTLEDWFLLGEQAALKAKVVEKLGFEGISPDVLEQMPYSVCSVQEFEALAQIIQDNSIRELVLNKVADKEKSTWAYATYLNNQYPTVKLRNLFPNELDKVIPVRFQKG